MTASLALAWLCLATAMAIVGAYVGFSKALVVVFPVFLLAFLRFAIAAVAMLPWLRRPKEEAPLTREQKRLLFVESFFGNFLFSICMLYGVARSSALAAGVIMAAIPAVVAVLSWLLLGERVPRRVAAGVACAVAGIALVSLARDPDGEHDPATLLGNLLLFGAVVCEAIYVVVGKRLSGSIGPKRISALINLWGLALVAPFGILQVTGYRFETPWGTWQASPFPFAYIPESSYVLLAAYAISASVITVGLWMTGMRRVPAASAGVFTVFLPISAAAVGVAFFGETFSAVQAAAFALALAGVVLASWRSGATAIP